MRISLCASRCGRGVCVFISNETRLFSILYILHRMTSRTKQHASSSYAAHSTKRANQPTPSYRISRRTRARGLFVGRRRRCLSSLHRPRVVAADRTDAGNADNDIETTQRARHGRKRRNVWGQEDSALPRTRDCSHFV